jgi:DNA-binding response OmpR family regulator
MTKRILVVDDDWLLGQNLKRWLEDEGYSVVLAGDCETARSAAELEKPDLVLLDIGLPDCSGFDLAPWLRDELVVAFIFITARTQAADEARGLELGAEDYITKPFKRRDLLARIQAVLERVERGGPGRRAGVLVVNDVTLDPYTHQVRVRGQLVDLRPEEFELLHLLMANAGQVLTNEYLLETVWGPDYAGVLQVLYVHIGWLRERIEVDPRRPRLIQTVPGVGYLLTRLPPAP